MGGFGLSVLDLFLLTNMLCSTSALPLMSGLLAPSAVSEYITGEIVVLSCVLSILCVSVYGTVLSWDGDASVGSNIGKHRGVCVEGCVCWLLQCVDVLRCGRMDGMYFYTRHASSTSLIINLTYHQPHQPYYHQPHQPYLSSTSSTLLAHTHPTYPHTHTSHALSPPHPPNPPHHTNPYTQKTASTIHG